MGSFSGDRQVKRQKSSSFHQLPWIATELRK
jgi:hypothetical protein